AYELALPARDEPAHAAQAVAAVGEPALGHPPPPSANGVLCLGAVHDLERLVQTAEVVDRRAELLVVSRLLVQVLREPRRVGQLVPAVVRDLARGPHSVRQV